VYSLCSFYAVLNTVYLLSVTVCRTRRFLIGNKCKKIIKFYTGQTAYYAKFRAILYNLAMLKAF